MQKINHAPAAVIRQKRLLYRITTSAVFLALALVLKLSTTFYLPVLGAAGLKIDFSGIFTVFPSILFGPWYGAAVCALADLLGHFIKPAGAYLPLLTLTQFASGFLIGAMWRLLTQKTDAALPAKRITAFVVAALIAIGCFGGACHISLYHDGVIGGFIVKQEELPTKGLLTTVDYETNQPFIKLSPLSDFVCSLARYNKDSLTVTRASDNPDTKMVVIPYAAPEADMLPANITKIADGAFDGLTSLHTVYISPNVTSIADGVFADADEDITIYTTVGSYAVDYARNSGIACIEMDEAEEEAYLGLLDVSEFKTGVADFTSNDSYRKYLSGYIGFVTIGLELISLLGLAFIAAGALMFRRGKYGDNEPPSFGYVRMLAVIFIPRLIITTINTEILRQCLAVWNGRAFWVLLIPRIGEEIIGCVIQAYIILLLYTVYESKIAKRFPAIKE